jgi:hypothetical protein
MRFRNENGAAEGYAISRLCTKKAATFEAAAL